jgi:hypothetical protein
MDIKKANTGFKIEDLVDGKLAKNSFQVDYLPMWQFLDNMDRKIEGGLKTLPLEKVLEGVYEYATIQVSLDKADTQVRIDHLNEANLKWHTRTMDLEAQVEQLKISLLESQSINLNSSRN